jgi:chloramphenicol O-acetyltransferase
MTPIGTRVVRFAAERIPAKLAQYLRRQWLGFFEPDISLAERNLQPMCAFCKFTDRKGKTNMPLSMRLSHSVRDGYHAG